MAVESVSTLASNAASVQSANAANEVRQARREPPPRKDGETGRPERGQGLNKLYDAVAQALDAAGVKMPAKAEKPGESEATNDKDRDDGASNGGDIRQALNSFMHSLVQAASGNPTTATNANEADKQATTATSPGRGYGNDLSTKIDSLLQNLGSSTSETQTNGLQASFNKLVETLQTAADSSSAAQTSAAQAAKPDLQAFLQNLKQNLQNQGKTINALGVTVDTQA